MLGISNVKTDDEIKACVTCINNAFANVALQYSLTMENAPNNGAFLGFGKLKSEMYKGLELFMYVDNSSGRVLGTLGVKKISEQKWEASRLSVEPSFQGKGIGAGLLLYLENHICKTVTENPSQSRTKNSNEENITLGCIADDQGLIGFYEKNGFTITAVKSFKKLPHKVCFMSKKVKV